MAEGGTLSLSQESLPLSEETCRLLLQQLEELEGFPENVECSNMPSSEAYVNMMLDESQTAKSEANIPVQDDLRKWNGLEMVHNQEQSFNINLANLPNQMTSYRPASSLPAAENWPGDFNFEASFRCVENVKGVNYILSKEQNKLYVKMDAPCPVNFSTSMLMPGDVVIRAVALFSSSEHASETVTRCINHSMNELEKGVFEAEHLIRCLADSAFYEKDPVTKRHSVVVPFENPPAGQHYSSYVYKFMCFGSCAGGPNRRPLMLVFTLEQGGIVLGRQKVNLKICSCPERDCKSDEKRLQNTLPPKSKEIPLPRPGKRLIEDTFDGTPEAFLKISKKKFKSEKEKEPYVIKVWDKKCYEFLQNMKRYFRAYVLIRKHYPSSSGLARVLSSMSSGSDS